MAQLIAPGQPRPSYRNLSAAEREGIRADYEDPRRMPLKVIAQKFDVDVSTVSRTARAMGARSRHSRRLSEAEVRSMLKLVFAGSMSARRASRVYGTSLWFVCERVRDEKERRLRAHARKEGMLG